MASVMALNEGWTSAGSSKVDAIEFVGARVPTPV